MIENNYERNRCVLKFFLNKQKFRENLQTLPRSSHWANGQFCLVSYWLMASFPGFLLNSPIRNIFLVGIGVTVTGHFLAALRIAIGHPMAIWHFLAALQYPLRIARGYPITFGHFPVGFLYIFSSAQLRPIVFKSSFPQQLSAKT